MNPDEPLPTRASLLERLKNTSDDTSWAEFDRTYRGLLMGVARRAGLNEEEADEAVQETLIALARKLPEFHYDPGKDSFKGWLLQIARWKIVDQVRRRRHIRGTTIPDEGTSVAERMAMTKDSEPNALAIGRKLPDPHGDFGDFDSMWNAEWERYILEQALARVKRQAKPEHYAIYHLFAIEQQSIAEVRHTLGVSAATIYLAKHRVGALIKKEILRLREEGR